jgi:hypothetical protein
MDRIDTHSEFKRSVVAPDFREFMENKADLRKAWHCAGSLFHLHEWVYAAHKASIDRKYMFVDDYRKTKPVSCAADFATSLGQKYSDFQLVRGIANASKHFVLHPVPPSRVNPPGMPSHAANTYVSAAKWDSATWDQDVFDDIGEVKLQRSTGDIEFATLAQSVWDMWNQLFAKEGW